jgi:hypothetical protein
MKIKNVISAVLLAWSAVFLVLTLHAPLAQSVSGAPVATAAATARLVPIGNFAGNPVHVAVQDQYTYLIDMAKRITVVDIQTPTAPITVGVGSYSDCYSGPHCFPWFPAYGRLVISGTYLYIPLFDLRIVNVANPANPIEAVHTQPQRDITAVVLKGQYAYASGRDYLYIIDVSSPLSPTEVFSSSVPGQGYYMALAGDYLYVSRSDVVHVLDISNPISPTEISSYLINTINGGPIAVTSQYAYVGEGTALHVLDVSNPAQITETGRYTASSSIWSVSVAAPYVHLIAGGTGDVHTLDVSDPAHPIEVASYLGLSSNDVVAANGYVFVAGDSGLTILRLMTHQVFLPLVRK